MPQYDDNYFQNIPFVKEVKTAKRLLETLKEMNTGELFAMLKLQDIADRFSSKSSEKISALKVSALIRNIFGDHVIEVHQSRYYAVISIDSLNRILKKYENWKV